MRTHAREHDMSTKSLDKMQTSATITEHEMLQVERALLRQSLASSSGAEEGT